MNDLVGLLKTHLHYLFEPVQVQNNKPVVNKILNRIASILFLFLIVVLIYMGIALILVKVFMTN